MDPVSTIKIAGTAIEIAGKVGEYIIKVKGAKEQRRQLLDGVRGCEYTLRRFLDELDDVERDSDWPKKIEVLEKIGTPVERLFVALRNAKEQLESTSGMARLAWPFTENDVQEILKAIEREKNLLSLSMNAASM